MFIYIFTSFIRLYLSPSETLPLSFSYPNVTTSLLSFPILLSAIDIDSSSLTFLLTSLPSITRSISNSNSNITQSFSLFQTADGQQATDLITGPDSIKYSFNGTTSIIVGQFSISNNNNNSIVDYFYEYQFGYVASDEKLDSIAAVITLQFGDSSLLIDTSNSNTDISNENEKESTKGDSFPLVYIIIIAVGGGCLLLAAVVVAIVVARRRARHSRGAVTNQKKRETTLELIDIQPKPERASKSKKKATPEEKLDDVSSILYIYLFIYHLYIYIYI